MKRQPKPTPNTASTDDDLIAKCIIYTQSLAAFHASFAADPDGNSVNAEKVAFRFLRRARATLKDIAETAPKTSAGLEAKARVAELLVKDSADHAPIEVEREFLKEFATNVRAFIAELTEAEEQKAA